MISPEDRPRLASKARLRADKKTGGTLLLYPEAGLSLNATGAEVVRRCDGARTVANIIRELQQAYAPADPARIEAEVQGLVQALVERGLLVVAP